MNKSAGQELIRRTASQVESMQRDCSIWKANNGLWYMDLANHEYGDEDDDNYDSNAGTYDDSTCYGPFDSQDAAIRYLRNFSNPGGYGIDVSGRRPPPTESGNGSPVQRPRGGY